MPSIGAVGVSAIAMAALYTASTAGRDTRQGVSSKAAVTHVQQWGHKPEYSCCTAVAALH